MLSLILKRIFFFKNFLNEKKNANSFFLNFSSEEKNTSDVKENKLLKIILFNK